MAEETEAPRDAGAIDEPHLPPHLTYPLPLPLPLHGRTAPAPLEGSKPSVAYLAETPSMVFSIPHPIPSAAALLPTEKKREKKVRVRSRVRSEKRWLR